MFRFSKRKISNFHDQLKPSDNLLCVVINKFNNKKYLISIIPAPCRRVFLPREDNYNETFSSALVPFANVTFEALICPAGNSRFWNIWNSVLSDIGN